jgi:hypothetical protein
MRTFIAEGSTRNDLAAHVYDITYNSIIPKKDTIAVIDDSIVRGTTLKQSIIKILSRLDPKEIIIISSSPQIRYPDCYGIDMSRMGEFIAFNAAVSLIKERGMEKLLSEVYRKCKAADNKPLSEFISSSTYFRQGFICGKASYSELCKGDICSVHRGGNFCKDCRACYSRRFKMQCKSCVSKH